MSDIPTLPPTYNERQVMRLQHACLSILQLKYTSDYTKHVWSARPEKLTAVLLKSWVFWEATPFRPVNNYRKFKGAYCIGSGGKLFTNRHGVREFSSRDDENLYPGSTNYRHSSPPACTVPEDSGLLECKAALLTDYCPGFQRTEVHLQGSAVRRTAWRHSITSQKICILATTLWDLENLISSCNKNLQLFYRNVSLIKFCEY
jgi:hypothetical protein